MKNIVLAVIKKIILAICLIYAFNLVAEGLKIIIPINIITIGVVSMLGASGLLALVAVYFVLV